MAPQEVTSAASKTVTTETVLVFDSDMNSPLLEGENITYDACLISEAQTPQHDTIEVGSKKSVWALLSVLLIGVFISQADTTLVLATYGSIASEFGELHDGSWLLSSYMLAQCVGQPLYGKLSDIFGRHAMIQVSYGLFTVGSLLCCICSSMLQLVAARAIQGLGGAGMVSLVSIIIADILPIREVATYRSYVNVVQTVGRSSGGVIGGLLAQAIGWRWTLAGQGPLTMLAMVLLASNTSLFQIKAESEVVAEESVFAKLKRIDFIGAFLMSTAILSTLLVLDIGGQKVSWDSIIIFVLIGVGVVSAMLFIGVEKYWAKEPVFPLHLLSNYSVTTSYLLLALQNASQVALMFLIPPYFQVTKNASSAEAGAYMVPSIAGNTVGGLLSGYLIKRSGRYKIASIASSLSAFLCFTLLIIFWRGHTSTFQALFVFPGGFATGVAHSALFVALASHVGESDMAIGASGLYLSGSIGAVSGLAGASAVFQSGLQMALNKALIEGGIPHGKEIAEKALSDIRYVQGLKGKLHELVVGAYIASFEKSFWMSLGLASLCILISTFSIEKRLK